MLGQGSSSNDGEGHEPSLVDLIATVERLRTELAELRTALTTEVRTHRIVLVEDDGFERLVLETGERFGRVMLSGRPGRGRAASVELFTNDPVDDHGAHVGVALTDDENVVAVFEVVERHRPTLWLEGRDNPAPAGD
ncbi:MAG: hypothetical protein ACT4PI_09715 [Actinomycetota bacterium]